MSADLGYWHEQMKAWRTRAEKAEAELVALRHDLSVAQNWVEHHSKHADDLIAVNVALRATWSGWFEVVDGAERLAAFPKYSLAKDYADGTGWTIRPVIDAAKGGAK